MSTAALTTARHMDEQKIRDLAWLGLTLRQMAARLGTSPNSLHARMRKLRISTVRAYRVMPYRPRRAAPRELEPPAESETDADFAREPHAAAYVEDYRARWPGLWEMGEF